jgi:hypothetical protein
MKTEYKRKQGPLIAQLMAGGTSLFTFVQFVIMNPSDQRLTGLIFLINGIVFTLIGILYILKTPSITLDKTQIDIRNLFSQKTIDYKEIDTVDFDVKGKIKLKLKDQTHFEFWIKAVPDKERVSFTKDLSEKVTQTKS